jgi:hypothetical protein
MKGERLDVLVHLLKVNHIVLMDHLFNVNFLAYDMKTT